MSRAVLSAICVFALCSPAFAQFSIDSPTLGSVQSGAVAPPNGWKCPRNGEITARIDGGPPISFVEDLSRGDTATVCGNNGNNGFFTVPWNWNVSGDGPHTIEFFDAGELFATVDFTVATFGTEFLFGAGGQCTIQDFPDPGGDITVSWDPAIQNFRITDMTTQTTPPPPPPPPAGSLNALLGRWLFSYTILSTLTQIYDLQAVVTVNGVQAISGEDEFGDAVVAARIEDLVPGSGLPYDFALLDPSIILCRFYVFNQTSANDLSGLYFQTDIDFDGSCGSITSNGYTMTGSRLSGSLTQALRSSPMLQLSQDEAALAEVQGKSYVGGNAAVEELLTRMKALAP